ncbi:MFS general substrate transporter [Thozetella sp. PMI_491]|nr:MFS general substrate transporter [Thozetella sp. PMI_491]
MWTQRTMEGTEESRENASKHASSGEVRSIGGAENVEEATQYQEEGSPKIYTSMILTVLAVNVIYFAHLVNLVGAGAQGQTIATHFNSSENTVWLLGPITILTVTLGPIVSQAADYWGRKWFLVILTTLGAVGCLIIALADSMAMVIAGFTVMGTAYGTQPLLHAVTSEVIPRRWRGWGQATNMISNSLGSAVGLIGGGALNRTSDPASNGFRYFYYMTMGFFLLGAILCAVVYNPPGTPRQGLPTREKLKKLDWIGYFLLSSGLTCFCIGISWYQNPYPWSDAHVVAFFAVGVAMLTALALYETLVKKDGMFHHDLFRYSGNYNFVICILCVFAEGAAFFAGNSFFVFQVRVLYENDALLSGTRYTIMFIVAGVGAFLTGLYLAVTRKARWITVSAYVVFVVFFVSMATTNRDTDQQTWGYPVLMGTALGITLTSLVTIAQLSTPPELIAIASGLMLTLRAFGGAIGLTAYHAIFAGDMSSLGQNIAQAAINEGLPPSSVGRFIQAVTSHNEKALPGIPGVNPNIIQKGVAALLDTYVTAFRHVWIAAGAIVAVATILSVFLVDRQEELNMQIDAPLLIEAQSSREKGTV